MIIFRTTQKILFPGTACLAIILLLFLGGCLPAQKPRPRIDYYTLEYPAPTPATKSASPLPVIIKVERFSISPTYDTDKITYLENGTISNYTYHRWRANPADLVTYGLTRDLQAGDLFAAVLPFTGTSSPSHVLEGTVDEFFELDEKNSWQAVLSITVTLLRFDEPDISKRVVLQKSFSRRIECPDKHPLSVSRAMAKAMAEISGRLSSELYSALK
jgi:ABC-type uncharacterized transport system auxiliary subunit